MVSRPPGVNAYEFVIVASLRAQQLMKGCLSQVGGDHKATIRAQMEVATGLIARVDDKVPAE